MGKKSDTIRGHQNNSSIGVRQIQKEFIECRGRGILDADEHQVSVAASLSKYATLGPNAFEAAKNDMLQVAEQTLSKMKLRWSSDHPKQPAIECLMTLLIDKDERAGRNVGKVRDDILKRTLGKSHITDGNRRTLRNHEDSILLDIARDYIAFASAATQETTTVSSAIYLKPIFTTLCNLEQAADRVLESYEEERSKICSSIEVIDLTSSEYETLLQGSWTTSSCTFYRAIQQLQVELNVYIAHRFTYFSSPDLDTLLCAFDCFLLPNYFWTPLEEFETLPKRMNNVPGAIFALLDSEKYVSLNWYKVWTDLVAAERRNDWGGHWDPSMSYIAMSAQSAHTLASAIELIMESKDSSFHANVFDLPDEEEDNTDEKGQ